MSKYKINPDELNNLSKEAIILLYQSLNDRFDDVCKQNQALSKKLDQIMESLAMERSYKYGRKSEKDRQIPGQLSFDFENVCIINEAELLKEKEGSTEPKLSEAVPRTRKRGPNRKKTCDLSGIPVRVIDAAELSPEELSHLFPQGYKRLPDKISKELVMKPAEFVVHEYHTAVYVSNRDEAGNTEFAYGPSHGKLFGSNSIASPELIAGIINGKYGNANPLHRLAESFLQQDVHLLPQDLAGWCIKAADRYFKPLYELMHREMQKSLLIHADESFFKLTEDMKERGANAKSYMWLYHTDQRYGSHPIFLYEYCKTRSSENPAEFLKDFRGTLVTDGYGAYHKLARENPDRFTIAGCWAHANRRYMALVKASTKHRAKGSVAFEAHQRIQAIYHVDNMYKDLNPEDRLRQRQSNVKPLVDAFFEYLKKKAPYLDSSSETGKAVQYSLNQEAFLREFLNNGIIPLDNNDAERSIRQFCVNRANWHVINSRSGATASGILLSMTETAKANGLKVYQYLSYVLDQMAQDSHQRKQKITNQSWDTAFLERLLPWSDSLPDTCRMNKQ